MKNIMKWVGAAAIVGVAALPTMGAIAQGTSEEDLERIYLTSPGYAAEGARMRAARMAREQQRQDEISKTFFDLAERDPALALAYASQSGLTITPELEEVLRDRVRAQEAKDERSVTFLTEPEADMLKRAREAGREGFTAVDMVPGEAGRRAADWAIEDIATSERSWPVLYVIDGDTVRVRLPDGRVSRVRIRSMDAPKTGTRARCQGERDKGERAKAYLFLVIEGAARVVFVRPTTKGDKYGRILADMLADGKMVSALLIDAGLARPYSGGLRQSWCP